MQADAQSPNFHTAAVRHARHTRDRLRRDWRGNKELAEGQDKSQQENIRSRE